MNIKISYYNKEKTKWRNKAKKKKNNERNADQQTVGLTHKEHICLSEQAMGKW